MSCEANAIAAIFDVSRVKQILFEVDNASYVEEKWLQRCCMTISPMGDVMVLAHNTRAVILTSKFTGSSFEKEKILFHKTWEGMPEQCQHNEKITSLLCIPFNPSNKKGSTVQYYPDWTCVAIGFSSGYVRFYTENGRLLISQSFHDEPVLNIKHHLSLGASEERVEEFLVIYKSVFCSILGFSLYNTLKACRNQLARMRENNLDSPKWSQLVNKRWRVLKHECVEDIACIGSTSTDPFQHFLTATVCGGYNATYRSNPPRSSLIIAIGRDPFLGFHYAVDSSTPPVLTDVAKAVASKLKSAIGQSVPSWLLGSKNAGPTENTIEVDKSMVEMEDLEFRYGVEDDGRTGLSIVVSPFRDLVAVSDSLGRISLIDVTSGLVTRMWKGYRGAQCGFVVVHEAKVVKGSKRKGMFLIIYTGTKGTLEVWLLSKGTKITSLCFEKYGKLMYFVRNRVENNSVSNCTDPVCILLLPSGNLIELSIPFHYILSGEDSEKAHDAHLLKLWTKLISNCDVVEEMLIEEAIKLAQNIKTLEFKKQALDSFLSNREVKCNLMLPFLETLRTSLPFNDDKSCSWLRILDNAIKITKMYESLTTLTKSTPEADEVDNAEHKMREILHLSETELDKIMSLLPPVCDKSEKRVTFSAETEQRTQFANFISAFQLSEKTIKFAFDTQDLKATQVSRIIFDGVANGKLSLVEWKETLSEGNISPTHLMRLLIRYWLDKLLGITIQREILALYEIANCILELAGSRRSEIKWKNIRSQIAQSKSPLSSITAAIVCRTLSAKIEKMAPEKYRQGEKDADLDSDEDWENITQEECDWNIFIGQLEDIALLNGILRTPPLKCAGSLYQLPYETSNVTLAYLLRQGKGSISELVAKWIASSGTHPRDILEIDCKNEESYLKAIEFKSSSGSDGDDVSENSERENNTILDTLLMLRSIFPHSLSTDSILSNIAWEYILIWKKNMQNMVALRSTIEVLEHIPSPHVRRGCCSLIWKHHLAEVCMASAKVINKVGKLPKDRLCRHDIGISEDKVVELLEIWTRFNDIFLSASSLSKKLPTVKLKYEILWNNINASNHAAPSLCQLTLDQKEPNDDVIHLLSQYSRCLLVLTTFSIRIQKPMNTYFNNLFREDVFENLQLQVPLTTISNGQVVKEARISLIKKAISSVLQQHLSPNTEQNVDISQCAEMMKPVVRWISLLFDLSKDWGLSLDVIKQHHICQLYNYSYDMLAEELVATVNDKEELASKLMTILGLRLKILLEDSPQYYADFSPLATTWVQSLKMSEEIFTTAKFSELLQLALTINNLLPENGRNNTKNVVNELVESLEMLCQRETRL